MVEGTKYTRRKFWGKLQVRIAGEGKHVDEGNVHCLVDYCGLVSARQYAWQSLFTGWSYCTHRYCTVYRNAELSCHWTQLLLHGHGLILGFELTEPFLNWETLTAVVNARVDIGNCWMLLFDEQYRCRNDRMGIDYDRWVQEWENFATNGVGNGKTWVWKRKQLED